MHATAPRRTCAGCGHRGRRRSAGSPRWGISCTMAVFWCPAHLASIQRLRQGAWRYLPWAPMPSTMAALGSFSSQLVQLDLVDADDGHGQPEAPAGVGEIEVAHLVHLADDLGAVLAGVFQFAKGGGFQAGDLAGQPQDHGVGVAAAGNLGALGVVQGGQLLIVAHDARSAPVSVSQGNGRGRGYATEALRASVTGFRWSTSVQHRRDAADRGCRCGSARPAGMDTSSMSCRFQYFL